jgi:hypothetical protein
MLFVKQMAAICVLYAVITVLFAPSSTAQQPEPTAPSTQKAPLAVDEVISNLEQRNREREMALHGFEGTRVYSIQYRGLFGNREAEMTVSVRYVSPGDKEFTVVSQSGSKLLIDHVLKGLLEAEKEAAGGESHQRSVLSRANYDFAPLETETSDGAPQYVFEVTPKTAEKFLYRGKIWVDGQDFAVTRIEAEPAKNPSFWIKKSEIRHRYEKLQNFWLPAETKTQSSIRLGGRALLSIEYQDYKIMDNAADASARDGSASTLDVRNAALR